MKQKYTKAIISFAITAVMVFSIGIAYPSAAEKGDSQLTSEQKNSIAMLNYLTVSTEKINASKDNWLYLDEAYSALINNTYPNAVDQRTQSHMTQILDTIEGYRMIDVKRDRLRYLYEQNQAQAIRSAIPNPLGLLSATQSWSLGGLITSGLYMTVDSITGYKSAKSEMDKKYLEDGWELDDEQAERLHNIRKDSFVYMLDMVRDNDLPGHLALNEESVKDFVKWNNNKNVDARIQFLESNEKVYKAFGDYWLSLAQSYYENGNYKKCVGAVDTYEKTETIIFRKDHALAKTLPTAIDSVGVLYSKKKITKEQYIKRMNHYVPMLIENTENDEWNLRYFGAQAYIDMSKKTGDKKYLKEAYSIALNNANYLVEDQRSMNESYMKDVKEKEKEIPDDATKQAKKEIKEYNKLLKAERKTELIPVTESLALNCDLLFCLAKELKISDKEKKKIDGILHKDGEALFLTAPLDNTYRFNKDKQSKVNKNVVFDWDKIEIPATCVSTNSEIVVAVTEGGKTNKYSDWTVDKVKRDDEADVNSFTATYSSKKIKDQDLSEKTTVQLTIDPEPNSSCPKLQMNYKVDDYTKILFLDRAKFVEVK